MCARVGILLQPLLWITCWVDCFLGRGAVGATPGCAGPATWSCIQLLRTRLQESYRMQRVRSRMPMCKARGPSLASHPSLSHHSCLALICFWLCFGAIPGSGQGLVLTLGLRDHQGCQDRTQVHGGFHHRAISLVPQRFSECHVLCSGICSRLSQLPFATLVHHACSTHSSLT